MKVIKNYGKKNKLLIRIAVAIKGFTGTMTAYVYFGEHNPELALLCFAIGAAANEVVNFMGGEDKGV
jgi:hypothetical protein